MKLFLILLAVVTVRSSLTRAAEIYDVAVFGAMSGGVIAAVQAARMGRRVVLVDPGKHVGGMTSSGLGWIDIHGTAPVGGMAREFFDRVTAHYALEGVDLRKFGNRGWTVEPHVAEDIFNAMLKEAGVPVHFGFRLASVSKVGTRLTEIMDEDGRVIRAKVFIDASYEGDLMARAKVTYVIGREPREQYGESLAGIMPNIPTTGNSPKLDPYLTPGEVTSGLIPLVQANAVGNAGDASDAIQAYNYRLCLTRDPANRVPIAPPPDYDPKRYELLGRYVAAVTAAGKSFTLRSGSGQAGYYFLKTSVIAHNKTDTNNSGRISTDYVGYNQGYLEADYTARQAIAKAHENYMRGLFTFLATDQRVPRSVREEMKTWGLAKDEFQDNGGWPFQLYVRQARRFVGEYVMTQNDAQRRTHFTDSVGMASYALDSHSCRRLVDGGEVIEEGGFYKELSQPYPISYRALTPKASECENLLVPACCSATHVAYASVRMEPVFMILGQSCGTAAAASIDEKSSVQNVDIKRLQMRLVADKQVLELPHKE